LLVDLDLDVQVRGVDLQVLVAECLELELVQRVRRVGDEFPEEGVLVRIHRVDQQIQQLTSLRLELELFDTRSHGWFPSTAERSTKSYDRSGPLFQGAAPGPRAALGLGSDTSARTCCRGVLHRSVME